MSKTMELRTELQRLLIDCCSNVFYEKASTPYKYPYLVYEIHELSYADNKTILQMEVNAIDYGEAKAQIENLSDRIQENFDCLHVLKSGVHFSVYKDKRHNVQEADKKVIRRRMLFEIHLHERR